MKPLRLIVADDHPLVHETVRHLLESADDIEIVAMARSGAEVLPLIDELRPDLVLLDVLMPEVDGLTCLETVRERYPEVRVVMFSVLDEPEQIDEAFRRGASGYIAKTIEPDRLAWAIRAAASDPKPRVFGCAAEHVSVGTAFSLTATELDVLKRVAQGLSDDAIASELGIEEQTAQELLQALYRKIGIPGRAEAARFARDQGFLDESELPLSA